MKIKNLTVQQIITQLVSERMAEYEMDFSKATIEKCMREAFESKIICDSFEQEPLKVVNEETEFINQITKDMTDEQKEEFILLSSVGYQYGLSDKAKERYDVLLLMTNRNIKSDEKRGGFRRMILSQLTNAEFDEYLELIRLNRKWTDEEKMKVIRYETGFTKN